MAVYHTFWFYYEYCTINGEASSGGSVISNGVLQNAWLVGHAFRFNCLFEIINAFLYVFDLRITIDYLFLIRSSLCCLIIKIFNMYKCINSIS